MRIWARDSNQVDSNQVMGVLSDDNSSDMTSDDDMARDRGESSPPHSVRSFSGEYSSPGSAVGRRCQMLPGGDTVGRGLHEDAPPSPGGQLHSEI